MGIVRNSIQKYFWERYTLKAPPIGWALRRPTLVIWLDFVQQLCKWLKRFLLSKLQKNYSSCFSLVDFPHAFVSSLQLNSRQISSAWSVLADSQCVMWPLWRIVWSTPLMVLPTVVNQSNPSLELLDMDPLKSINTENFITKKIQILLELSIEDYVCEYFWGHPLQSTYIFIFQLCF